MTPPGLGERHGRLTGATADLDYPVPSSEPCVSDQVIEQLGGTDRPDALVVLRGPVEPGPQHLAPRVIRHEFMVLSPHLASLTGLR
jgi:hypothetical protein